MESAEAEPILQCPTCRSALSVNREVESVDERCPVCQSEVSLHVFPRLYREPVDTKAGKLASDEEARCNFYPELPAEKVCDECGCFLSGKAAIRWGDLDLCLPCLHRLREEKKSSAFVARASLHDNRALALVTLLAPLSLFTAPVAIFLLIKNRKNPETFEPRNAARWWVAMILAVAWLVVWAVLITALTSLVLADFQ